MGNTFRKSNFHDICIRISNIWWQYFSKKQYASLSVSRAIWQIAICYSWFLEMGHRTAYSPRLYWRPRAAMNALRQISILRMDWATMYIYLCNYCFIKPICDISNVMLNWGANLWIRHMNISAYKIYSVNPHSVDAVQMCTFVLYDTSSSECCVITLII